MISMTRREAELLKFVKRQLAEDGVAPTFDEMRGALGLKSKSGVHRLLAALEERGYLRRLKHRKQAMELVGAAPDASDLATMPIEALRVHVNFASTVLASREAP